MPILTFDGTLVDPDGSEAPSLRDIALALSRAPRFAGHTRQWFSVLDHSQYVLMLADFGRDLKAHVQLALLLHDAHEALTADVPTDFKSAELRLNQKKLDSLIIGKHYGGQHELWASLSPIIKEFDQRALMAEAMVVGSPGFTTMPNALFVQRMGGLPREDDMSLLRDRLKRGVLSNPQMLLHNEEAPNVKRFIWMAEALKRAAEPVLYPMAAIV